MSVLDSRAAVERLAEIRRTKSADDFAAYAFLVLGLVGWNSPDVLTFFLDQADRQIGEDA